MKRILIIEDDSHIAEIEKNYLEVNDFVVDIAETGDCGIRMARAARYDLILLDLMLPGTDGFGVCAGLREILDIPIIIVTAKQEDIDTIKGLKAGADDYVIKPFSPNVLVARVKSSIAWYERLKQSNGELPEEIAIGDIRIQTGARRVFVGGVQVDMKNKEYELFLFLVSNKNIVFSKEALYERIWGFDALGDNATVTVHINRLREKIEKEPSNPQYIQTVRGAGYRFGEQ